MDLGDLDRGIVILSRKSFDTPEPPAAVEEIEPVIWQESISRSSAPRRPAQVFKMRPKWLTKS